MTTFEISIIKSHDLQTQIYSVGNVSITFKQDKIIKIGSTPVDLNKWELETYLLKKGFKNAEFYNMLLLEYEYEQKN